MEKTIKELANELEISVSAIHNHKKRHAAELAPHFRKQGKLWLIDEVGQEFIREASLGTPKSLIADVTIIDEVDHLRKENSELKDKIIALQTEKFAMLEILNTAQLNEKLLEESRLTADKLEEQNKELQEQLQAEKQKSWWDKLIRRN